MKFKCCLNLKKHFFMLFKKWSKMIFSSCSSLIPFDKTKRFILSIILIKIQQNKEKNVQDLRDYRLFSTY